MSFTEEQKEAIKYLYKNIKSNTDDLIDIELISYDLQKLGESLNYEGKRAMIKGNKYKGKVFKCLGVSYTLGNDLYLKFDINGLIGSINKNSVKFI